MNIRAFRYRRLALAILAVGITLIASPLLDRPSTTTAGIPANTYIVTSNGDAGDALPGDLICNTGVGVCTLRAAIEEVNAGAGAGDSITFNIGGSPTIAPLSNLPAVQLPVAIDGTSQCATPPCVRLVPGGIGTTGLTLRGGASTIRGLNIALFLGSGITLEQFGGNFISGNFIGTNAAGTAANGNGIGIIDNSPGDNIIGGDVAADRNVISANFSHGIQINGGATLDRIRGNYIGTSLTGAAALGNGGDGIAITANQNTVGGGAIANVISGNAGNGVSISGNQNIVRNNTIGMNAAQTAVIGNSQNGILVTAGSMNTLGDSGFFQIISGNGGDGVQLNGATVMNTAIAASFIGTGGAGSADFGNTGNGVHILNGAHDNYVGQTFSVISGNDQNGVLIEGATSINNIVFYSNIGVTYSTGAALPNNGDGVRIVGTGTNRIGGDNALFWTTISGNLGNGVSIINSTGVVFWGNYIGTNSSGADVGNSGYGVYVQDSPNTLIGAATAGKRNIISGNAQAGILLTGANTTGAKVEGAYIGTNTAGTDAVPNLGGMIVAGGAIATIGGTSAGAGNLISGNTGPGLALNTVGNTAQGNKIGTDAAGTSALPNSYGIQVSLVGPGLNTIGGLVANAPNTIAFNTNDGVYVESSTANTIRRNSIHSNGQFGIRTVMGGNSPAFVTVETVTPTSVGGTTCANCIVDVYTDSNGEGRTFGGSTTANGAGVWTLTATLSGAMVTATGTDANGSTSMFDGLIYDSDGDGVVNGEPVWVDNCPSLANADQAWSDRNFIDQTPPSTQDDRTWPNSDASGDACDTDDDNDGILDTNEAAGCNASGPLSPTNRDTDGDRVLDGAECVLGTNPGLGGTNKPTAAQCATFLGVGVSVDTDGDRIFDRIEYCGYNTNHLVLDTDGDQDAFPLSPTPSVNLIKDGCEAASLNNDRAVNSGDQLLLVQEIAREGDQTLRLVNMDINKDGGVNSGDQLIVVNFIGALGSCP